MAVESNPIGALVPASLSYAMAMTGMRCTERLHRGLITALGGDYADVSLMEAFEVLDQDLFQAV